jgi:hypothetical protein
MADVIASSLTALPIHSLISAPLTACIEAQAAAAMSSVEFIREVGFDDNNDAVSIQFKYQKTRDDGTPGNATLTVPLLSVVNVPFIRIQDLTIDFEFKVHQAIARDISTTKNANLNISGSAKYLFFKAKTDLKVSYSKKEDLKSSLDKSATFRVQVKAAQDEMPAGLAEVLDLLKETIKESVA